MNWELLESLFCDEWRPATMLGPLVMLNGSSAEDVATGLGLCAILVQAMLIGFIHPRVWSLPISVVAVTAWFAVGRILEGVSC